VTAFRDWCLDPEFREQAYVPGWGGEVAQRSFGVSDKRIGRVRLARRWVTAIMLRVSRERLDAAARAAQRFGPPLSGRQEKENPMTAFPSQRSAP